MHPKMKHIYVGVDTHKYKHSAVIINCFNERLGDITFENKPSAYEELLTEVKKHVKRGVTAIYGLEDTGSAGRSLAVYLLEKKKMVKKINSTLTYNERKKNPIMHKTDTFDASCIAKVLLDNLDTVPDASPTDVYWTLAMLVGRRTAIVKSNIALKQQLHSYIVHHYPSYRKFFSEFDCKSAMAFWQNYPSPSKLKGVTSAELGKLLQEHSDNYYKEEKAKKILALVESDGDTRTDFQESRDFLVKTCIKQVKNNDEEMAKIEEEMKNLMSRLGYKLETMIGIELVTAAGFISQIGDIERFATPDKLAKFCGICPVTYSSGESEKHFKNRQGNRELYTLFHNLAARLINCGRNKNKPVHDIFYEYYNRKMSHGKTKHQAMICVMRRLVNIIYGLMKTKSEYVHKVLPKEKAE